MIDVDPFVGFKFVEEPMRFAWWGEPLNEVADLEEFSAWMERNARGLVEHAIECYALHGRGVCFLYQPDGTPTLYVGYVLADDLEDAVNDEGLADAVAGYDPVSRGMFVVFTEREYLRTSTGYEYSKDGVTWGPREDFDLSDLDDETA